jgi:hypothetical protein
MLVFSILAPIAVIAFLLFLNPYSLAESDKYWEFFTEEMVYIAFMIIMCGMLAFSAYGIWKDSLIFTSDTFERRCIPNLKDRPGKMAYSDIIRIFGSTLGTITIDAQDGTTFRISPHNYEGGAAAVLEELHKHIPEDRFDKDLQAMLKGIKRGQLFFTGFPLLVVAIMMLTLFFEDIVDLVRRDVAWKTEATAVRRESIQDFALAEDGSVWILTLDYYSGYEEPSSYTVKHLNGEATEVLQLPSKEELFPDGEDIFTNPEAIALSSEGLPVLNFFIPEVRLYWTGSKWEWRSPQDDWIISPIDSTDPYWKTLKETGLIIVGHLDNGEQEAISLGEYWEDFQMEYKRTNNGWIVVTIENKNGEVYFHSFKESTGQHIWVELGYGREYYRRLVDYTIDSSGNFYILFHHKYPMCEDGSVAIGIGTYQMDKGAWQLLESYYPEDCGRVYGYDQLIVDSRDRIWIPVGRAVAVYDKAIWEERKLLESEYRYYKESNSGYYVGHELVVGSDGRIWSLDSSGDALVWIDPNVDQLERPIWPWLAWLYEQWDLRLYVGFGSVGVLTLIAVVLSLINRRRLRDVE